MSEQMELVLPKKELLKVEQTMTKLQAENFIKPELTVYGKTVVDVAKEYPPKGTVVAKRGRKKKGWALLYESFKGPEVAESTYQRTGNFAAQWKRSTSGYKHGLREEIKNLAPYAGYVMGTKQPYTWRYGWRRLRKVMLEEMDFWIDEMLHKAFRLWERK